MYPQRFIQHNYNPHQSQWRPHGPRFNATWPMNQGRNPKTWGNFSNNEDHWCETCDRGFRTLEILLNHKQQHQKCNIDGCQFIAHPKVITKHIQMQHSTGLYKKIAKLQNPEEIEKWREERRKRYPTKENIEKKTAEVKEKINRGEKMGTRNQRDNKHRQTEQYLKRKGSQDNRKNFKRKFQEKKYVCESSENKNLIDAKKKHLLSQKEHKFNPIVNESKTLKPFAGILNLLDDTNNDSMKEDIEIIDTIEDDEYILMDESSDKNNSTTNEPVLCGALSSLICNYESSDEDSVNKNTIVKQNVSENVKAQSKMIDQNETVNTNNCQKSNSLDDLHKSDDDSGPEEAKVIKSDNTEGNIDMPINHSKESSILKSSKKQDRREQERSKPINIRNSTNNFKRKLPSTLLEKLLRNEIRQERNIILQCIRYIVRNNYFEETVND